MIAQAIEKIQELAENKILHAAGRAYAHDGLMPLPSPDVLANTLNLHTLSGIVMYTVENADSVTIEDEAVLDARGPSTVVVVSPTEVFLCSDVFGEFRQREFFVRAEPFLPERFPFGRYLDSETFIIGLQSCFVQDETTANLLQVLGNMQASSVGTVVDDGVSQTVASRKGITKLETVEIQNPVTLRPYRTFQEIEQPASRYVLRLRGDGESLPDVMLEEARDNQWQVEAINAIGAKLAELGIEIPVIA